MEQKPSIGRIVHYVSRGSKDGVFPPTCRAAVITEVYDNNDVALCVLNPTGIFFDVSIGYHDSYPETPEENVGGTWHWPERV